MSRRTATPQVTAQSGEELREGLLVVWERPARNSASSFYEAGIIESVDKGGESRRVHLAVLAPPPPSGFFLPACAHRSPRCGCSSLFVILIHIPAPQVVSPLRTPGTAPRIGTMRSRSFFVVLIFQSNLYHIRGCPSSTVAIAARRTAACWHEEPKRDQRRAKRREPKDQPTRKPHRSFCWAP